MTLHCLSIRVPAYSAKPYNLQKNCNNIIYNEDVGRTGENDAVNVLNYNA